MKATRLDLQHVLEFTSGYEDGNEPVEIPPAVLVEANRHLHELITRLAAAERERDEARAQREELKEWLNARMAENAALRADAEALRALLEDAYNAFGFPPRHPRRTSDPYATLAAIAAALARAKESANG